MKLNIAYPDTGGQNFIEVDDEKKLVALYEKRIGAEIEGADLGEEFTGYRFKITGGNDKQGFAMKQGVLTNTRVRLLLSKGLSCYRPRRTGERKRKSVRGCIVGPDLSVLNLVVVERGEQEIPGITDVLIPKRLGPKRADRIRKYFNKGRDDELRTVIITRTFENKKGKTVSRRPKIQRLITPITLHRKRQMQKQKLASLEKSKRDAAEYQRLVAQRLKEQKEARRSEISKRRSSRKASAKVDKTV